MRLQRPALTLCLTLLLTVATRPVGAQDVIVPEAREFPERSAWLSPEGYVTHSGAAMEIPIVGGVGLATFTDVRVPFGDLALRSRFGGGVSIAEPDFDHYLRTGHLFSPELGVESDMRGSRFRIVLGVYSNVPVGAGEVQEQTGRGPAPLHDDALLGLGESNVRRLRGGWDGYLATRDTWVGRLSMAAEVNLDTYVVVGAQAAVELWIGLDDGTVRGGFTSHVEGAARFWGASLAGLRSTLVLRPTEGWYGAGDLEPVFGLEPFLRLVPPIEPIAPLVELSTFVDLTSELRELTVRAALGMVF